MTLYFLGAIDLGCGNGKNIFWFEDVVFICHVQPQLQLHLTSAELALILNNTPTSTPPTNPKRSKLSIPQLKLSPKQLSKSKTNWTTSLALLHWYTSIELLYLNWITWVELALLKLNYFNRYTSLELLHCTSELFQLNYFTWTTLD